MGGGCTNAGKDTSCVRCARAGYRIVQVSKILSAKIDLPSGMTFHPRYSAKCSLRKHLGLWTHYV